MQEHELPTLQDMIKSARADLDATRSALTDAADWPRSGWRPLGSPLPDQVRTALRDVQRLGERIAMVKRAGLSWWVIARRTGIPAAKRRTVAREPVGQGRL